MGTLILIITSHSNWQSIIDSHLAGSPVCQYIHLGAGPRLSNRCMSCSAQKKKKIIWWRIQLFIWKNKRNSNKESSSVWGMASVWTKERGWRVRDAVTQGGGDWAQKQNHSVRAQFNLRFPCCVVWWVRNVQDNGVCTREPLTTAQRFSNPVFTSFWTTQHIHNRITSPWRLGSNRQLLRHQVAFCLKIFSLFSPEPTPLVFPSPRCLCLSQRHSSHV